MDLLLFHKQKSVNAFPPHLQWEWEIVISKLIFDLAVKSKISGYIAQEGIVDSARSMYQEHVSRNLELTN